MKGTVNSKNRQKPKDLDTQKEGMVIDEEEEGSPERDGREPLQTEKNPALPPPNVYIQPQITKSQEQYIAKRQQTLQHMHAQENRTQQKVHPLQGGSKPHASVQSRYMQQALVKPQVKKPDSQSQPQHSSYPVPNARRDTLKRGSSSKQISEGKKRPIVNQQQSRLSANEPENQNEQYITQKHQSIPFYQNEQKNGPREELEQSNALDTDVKVSQSELNVNLIQQDNCPEGTTVLNDHQIAIVEQKPTAQQTQERAIGIEKKQDPSDEMSTKSSKRLNQSNKVKQADRSPQTEDQIIQQAEIKPIEAVTTKSTGQKISKLFDQNSQIRKKYLLQQSFNSNQPQAYPANQVSWIPQSAIQQMHPSQLLTPKKHGDYSGPKHYYHVQNPNQNTIQNQYLSPNKLFNSFSQEKNARRTPERQTRKASDNYFNNTSDREQFLPGSNQQYVGISFNQYMHLKQLVAQGNGEMMLPPQVRGNHQQKQSELGSHTGHGHKSSKSNYNINLVTPPQETRNDLRQAQNQFLKNSGEEIAIGSKHQALINHTLGGSHQNQINQRQFVNNKHNVNHQSQMQPQQQPRIQAPNTVQTIPIKVFQIPGLANMTAKHVLLGSQYIYPPQNNFNDQLGEQGAQAGTQKQMLIQNGRVQYPNFNVGKQMQAFGSTNDNFRKQQELAAVQMVQKEMYGSKQLDLPSQYKDSPIKQLLLNDPSKSKPSAKVNPENLLRNQSPDSTSSKLNQLSHMQNHISKRISERQTQYQYNSNNHQAQSAQKPQQAGVFSGLDLAERDNYMAKSPSKTLKIKSASIFTAGQSEEHRGYVRMAEGQPKPEGQGIITKNSMNQSNGRMNSEQSAYHEELNYIKSHQGTIMMNVNLNSPKRVLQPMNVQFAGAPPAEYGSLSASATVPISKQKARNLIA